jgi:protein-S-isoprenylcysteine O-methyltransferase Ste14
MAEEFKRGDRRGLDLKIPPPAVALLVAILMWLLSRVTLVLAIRGSRMTAGLLAALGVVTALSGVYAVARAKTTIRPDTPEKTSTLLTGGIYHFTRNPMYLGLLIALTAWAVELAAPWTLPGPVIFALYIQRYQILPEERALAAKFGDTYVHYCKEVRRWI